MKRSRRDEIDNLLPLPPVVFEILVTLAGGERHGQDIKREVVKRAAGRIDLGPGTFYGAIERMMAQGLIQESDQDPDQRRDDERNHYYRLTPFGQAAAKAELARMEAGLRFVRNK